MFGFPPCPRFFKFLLSFYPPHLFSPLPSWCYHICMTMKRTHHFPLCVAEFFNRFIECIDIRSAVQQQGASNEEESCVRLAENRGGIFIFSPLPLSCILFALRFTIKFPATGGCSTLLKEQRDEVQVLKSNMDFTRLSHLSESPVPTI